VCAAPGGRLADHVRGPAKSIDVNPLRNRAEPTTVARCVRISGPVSIRIHLWVGGVRARRGFEGLETCRMSKG